MLPTLVIGLREGLEAALIVGIIAAFLRRQGRRDLLRWVFAGVGLAIVLCVAVGVTLEVVSRDLPQRQQEGLETVIGVLAVAMVTYMVLWMRRHSRELKGALETAAAGAMTDDAGSAGARAMVVMAFLAVLREGFETVVFLLAAFNESGSGSSAGAGAVVGLAIAVALGGGIYRGGVRLDLSKFFRATGLVLVLVAAGLVVTAFHTAHEAGWLNAGQGATVDLSWLVRPGSVLSSLLTGMLGVQPHPVVIEVIGWLGYVIPAGLYVAWPPGRGPSRTRSLRLAGLVGAAAAVAAVVVALAAPPGPRTPPVTSGGGLSVAACGTAGASMMLRISSAAMSPRTVTLTAAGDAARGGISLASYAATAHQRYVGDLPARLPAAAVARRNGGRLPLGLAAGAAGYRVSYMQVTTVHSTVEPRTTRVITASVSTRVMPTVSSGVGDIPLSRAVARHRVALPVATSAAALAAARHDLSRLDRRSDDRAVAVALGLLAAIACLGAGGAVVAGRRRAASLGTPPPPLVGHKVSLT